MSSLDPGRQRLDRWLWHARLVRTRTIAAKLAASGHVRLNGKRITASGRAIKPGNVLTIALSDRVRVLRVTGFSGRRSGATAARSLYDDLSPSQVTSLRRG